MYLLFKCFICALCLFPVAGCSTNPATGESQFTALMSPEEETRIGAEENAKILKQFGGSLQNTGLSAYVDRVGQRVAKNTERTDVRYKFFVLDTKVVNAFALPGGYVYVTRGLLELANSESQLAAVLAHEVGHITARHAAERYSHGVVSTLGAGIVAAALNSSAVAQAADFGSGMYTASYSRAQENQADELGIRYLSRAGYDPRALGEFLTALARSAAFEQEGAGKDSHGLGYFSTHPQTGERAAKALALAASMPPEGREDNREDYLHALEGLVYGDSPAQGFVRGRSIWHPQIGFTFTVPDGYAIANNPSEIVAKDKDSGTIVIFDIVPAQAADPLSYLAKDWMKGTHLFDAQSLEIGGRKAALASFTAMINDQPQTIRLAAIQWSNDRVFRFQIAVPKTAPPATVDAVDGMVKSLRPMTDSDRATIQPYHIHVFTAGAGDSVASVAKRAPFATKADERLRLLNGLGPDGEFTAGRLYKTVSE